MVGDNPHSDILGGINAGIDTCWLNTRDVPAPQDHAQLSGRVAARAAADFAGLIVATAPSLAGGGEPWSRSDVRQ